MIDESTIVCAAHCAVGKTESQVQVNCLSKNEYFQYNSINHFIKRAPILNPFYSILQKIVAGAHNIAKDEDSSWQVRKISKLWPHEDYDSNEFTNDISLLKLSEPLVFNEFVQPIKLAESQEIVKGISNRGVFNSSTKIIIFLLQV